MSVTKPRYYLIAKTLRHALTTADVDFDWKPSPRQYRYFDDKGNEVECVGAFEIARKLRGLDNVKVYWGYYGRSSVEPFDWELLKRMIALGRLQILN